MVGDRPNTLSQLEDVFGNIVSTFIPFAAVVLFVMIIIGGYQYLTAGGDAKRAAVARQTLTYAILGMVLIAMAYLIIRLISVITGITGIEEFTIRVD